MPKMKLEPFSQRLTRLRKARGFTQLELARITGISRRAIAHYETVGKAPRPDPVIRLAKGLGVSIDELLGFKTTQAQGIIQNRQLIRKMKLLDQLPKKEQKKVIDYINDLAAKYNKTNNH
jgi:transcriptional regulator with XRE-family HTH domain